MTRTSQQSNKKLTTKDDLVKLEKKLEKKLASKKDLEKFATKKDLEKFATKKEIKKDFEMFSIRAFDTFATKEDIKESERRITEKVEEKFDLVLQAVDGITVKHQEIGTERTANIGAHDRIEADITKTNKRVTTIEKKLEAIPVAA